MPKDDPGHLCQVGFVSFLLKSLALHDLSGLNDVGKIPVEFCKRRISERKLQTHYQFISDITVGMLDFVELHDFGDRDLEVIRDDEE